MKIENKKLRKEFALPGPCELCGKFFAKREGHHVFAKGNGGGGVLDIRINLITLGASIELGDGRLALSCECHREAQAYKITRSRVVEVVAIREGVEADDILEVVYWLKRLIKPQTEDEIRRRLVELSDGARVLAVRELVEAGKLTHECTTEAAAGS